MEAKFRFLLRYTRQVNKLDSLLLSFSSSFTAVLVVPKRIPVPNFQESWNDIIM